MSGELLEILKPGGRLAFSNWIPSESANIQILQEALQEHGDPDAPEPPSYPDWLFPSIDVYREVVSSPGLANGGVETVLHHWALQTPYDLFDSLLGINPRLQGHSAAHRARIREATAVLVERYRKGAQLMLPMRVVYGWAHVARHRSGPRLSTS